MDSQVSGRVTSGHDPSTPGKTGSATESPPTESSVAGIDRELQAMAARDAMESQRLRMAVVVAALFHAIMLIVTFPELRAEPKERPRRVSEVYVIQPMRFEPPAPRRERIPERKTKKIPIPDPTPDEPEPLEVEDLPLPEVDLPPFDAGVFGIPDAPPAVDNFGRGEVRQVGGGVMAPEKVFYPQPRYTEEARQARIQGIVILQAIIDTEGNVARLEVMKGLTLGLTESAIETVKTWRYKPATLNGKPVAVYMNLLINFSLQ